MKNSQRLTSIVLVPIFLLAVSANASAAETTSSPDTSRTNLTTKKRDPWLWPFAVASTWNTPIGSGAQYSAGTDLITKDLRTARPAINCGMWSVSAFLASAADPVRKVTGANFGSTSLYNINVPAAAKSDGSSDAWVTIVDPTHNTSVEMWQARGRPNGDLKASVAVSFDLRGDGWKQPMPHNPMLSGAAHAGGSSQLGGLIRMWELTSNIISHALAMGVSLDRLKRGPVWPSASEDGAPYNLGYTGNVPMGTLVAIVPTVDVTKLGLSSLMGLAVAHALQDYGAYVVVSGGKNQLTLYAETPAKGMPQITDIKNDLAKMRPYLATVLNNGPQSIGGGGKPRRPPAPDF